MMELKPLYYLMFAYYSICITPFKIIEIVVSIESCRLKKVGFVKTILVRIC